MLRLMGLPHVARFSKATVATRDGAIEVLFDGGRDAKRIEIPLRLLGNLHDLEMVELQLLARLQELGYEVERQPST
jgi:hypothetical protein